MHLWGKRPFLDIFTWNGHVFLSVIFTFLGRCLKFNHSSDIWLSTTSTWEHSIVHARPAQHSLQKACHIPLGDWSFSLGPEESTAWSRAPSRPWVTCIESKKHPFVVIRHWEFGVAHYCSLTKPNLIIPSFGFTHETFSGFLSQGNWEEKEENKSPQHATTGLGGLCRCELFFFPKAET